MATQSLALDVPHKTYVLEFLKKIFKYEIISCMRKKIHNKTYTVTTNSRQYRINHFKM